LFMMGSSFMLRCSDFGTSMPRKSQEESISSLDRTAGMTWRVWVQLSHLARGRSAARRYAGNAHGSATDRRAPLSTKGAP
jgi:hypothetical protein